MPKIVAQCQKYPIPNLNTLRDQSISLYNTINTISIHCRPILMHWRTYLNTLSKLYPILIYWPELYPIWRHWLELYPILTHWAELYPILIDWTELYPILIHYRRQPVKFEYYVTRVVSQSKSSITSIESSRLGLKTLLGFRVESARYSLSS